MTLRLEHSCLLLYATGIILAIILVWPLPHTSSPFPGVGFLTDNYTPEVGLIRESPETAPHRHWLATDNWLAARALKAAGQSSFARRLERRRNEFDAGRHGLIEALVGTDIVWPPGTPKQREVAPGVWMETRVGTARMRDWQDYADLAFYGALDAYNEGDVDLAHRRYRLAMQHFDGTGFRDTAFDGRYATYKVALALYIGDVLGYPPREDLRRILRAKRSDSGGFTALYNREGTTVGDANTETTSYAILALSRVR